MRDRARLMRSRVSERLSKAAEYPIVLIVAPAGFGKSVALRDFIETSRLDAVRFDVAREDSTLLSFARRFSEALKPVAPTALRAFPSLQQRILETTDPASEAAQWFAEHLRKSIATIAIDDLHFAAVDPASIHLIANLIERTAERVRWILATRTDIGLPVASWIAYGRMDYPVGEEDLRFTSQEALAAADAAHTLDANEVEALRVLTDGWPVALSIALRTRTHAADLRTASLGTREMVYRYLAEQVFESLSDAQRTFLLDSSVFTSFDIDLSEELGGAPEFLATLRQGVAFLSEMSPGVYRYHDLFRDFLESELKRRGGDAYNAAVCHGASLLEERGEEAASLALYARVKDEPSIVRILERSVFQLFERGEADTLQSALEALSETTRRARPAVLGLSAMLDARRGRFDVGERHFITAIERARDETLKRALVHRYAIELVRHGRDCSALLAPYANDPAIPTNMRIRMLGTLSTAYVHSRRINDALGTVEQALDLLNPDTDDETRARIYHQAAFVHQFGPSRDMARKYARLAAELATNRELYETAARAYSVLYSITYGDDDDPIASLAILDRLNEAAGKGGSTQVRLFGLIASYELEAERAADAALEKLDAALRDHPEALAATRRQTLLPALAMRAAWQKDFERAYGYVRGTALEEEGDEVRALRYAEIALYAFASRHQSEGEEALRCAAAPLGRIKEPSRRTVRARLFLAMAELVPLCNYAPCIA